MMTIMMTSVSFFAVVTTLSTMSIFAIFTMASSVSVRLGDILLQVSIFSITTVRFIFIVFVLTIILFLFKNIVLELCFDLRADVISIFGGPFYFIILNS